MLSLDITDEESAGCCLLARLIPKRRCCFSSLEIIKNNFAQQQGVKIFHKFPHAKYKGILPDKKNRISGKQSFSADKYTPSSSQ